MSQDYAKALLERLKTIKSRDLQEIVSLCLLSARKKIDTGKHDLQSILDKIDAEVDNIDIERCKKDEGLE
tara:strand:+ start:1585 stop:1794 length:210 start_codon:yes stop_codon:yes gene_type:complete